MKNETKVVKTKKGQVTKIYIYIGIDHTLVTVTSRYWDRLGEEWTSPLPEYDSAYSSIFSNL